MSQGVPQQLSYKWFHHGLRISRSFIVFCLVGQANTSSSAKNQIYALALLVGPKDSCLQPALSSSFGEGIGGRRYA